MKSLALLILLAAPLHAADILPSCTGSTCPAIKLSDTAASPLQHAKAAFNAALDNYEATSGSLAACKQALAVLTIAASDAQAALATARANLDALIGPVTPTPSTPIVAIIEVSSTTCPPCNAMDPVLADAVKAGVKISRVNVDRDADALKQWGDLPTPTFLMQVNAKTVTQYTGTTDKAALVDWYTKTVAWAARQKQ